MANLQKEFEAFHDKIRLTHEGVKLREKREIILGVLRDKLHRYNEELGDQGKHLKFAPLNQGSYAMNTGIKPLDDGDYDIDVGLRFHIDKDSDEWSDSVAIKSLVYEMLENHTADVKVKRPCVTVNYSASYHVDLAIYSSSEVNGEDHLSVGHLNSSEENKEWQPSDPRGLVDLINHYRDDSNHRKQFRRIVRYLKRWKDVCFRSSGNAAPVGIGLTISVYNFLVPQFDPLLEKADDLGALTAVLNKMLGAFCGRYREGEYLQWLAGRLPVEPRDDVYERMSNKQMKAFREKLEKLRDACVEARDEVDPHDAATKLKPFFGDDFPVPTIEESANRTDERAVITQSSSA